MGEGVPWLSPTAAAGATHLGTALHRRCWINDDMCRPLRWREPQRPERGIPTNPKDFTKRSIRQLLPQREKVHDPLRGGHCHNADPKDAGARRRGQRWELGNLDEIVAGSGCVCRREGHEWLQGTEWQTTFACVRFGGVATKAQ